MHKNLPPTNRFKKEDNKNKPTLYKRESSTILFSETSDLTDGACRGNVPYLELASRVWDHCKSIHINITGSVPKQFLSFYVCLLELITTCSRRI